MIIIINIDQNAKNSKKEALNKSPRIIAYPNMGSVNKSIIKIEKKPRFLFV